MRIVAVSLSAKKGEKKVNQPFVRLEAGHGVAGDAHADGTHRQLSLLGVESIRKMQAIGADVHPGDFAENVTTEGVCLYELPIGTRFLAGDGIELELTQIGKQCHSGCAIAKQVGSCVMPHEGVFCRILKGGILRPGDSFSVVSNPPENATFSHIAEDGSARMVNVGQKKETARTAIARAIVLMSGSTLALLQKQALPKGDALGVARIAGIMAAKRTPELIPLCHPLAITHADVRFKVINQPPSIEIESEVSTLGRTGVEMEAIIAAQIAASTIYDMCKAVQKDIVISEVRLLRKSGGKSGLFVADLPDLRLAGSTCTNDKTEQQKLICQTPAEDLASGLKIACITLSDKGARGEREDTSGPALLEALCDKLPVAGQDQLILPDEPEELAEKLQNLVSENYDLVVTTGGTGLGPRDSTPEAILPLLTRRLHGLEQAMLAAGLAATPRAALSRSLAGTIGKCLVLALPGSKKAALENLEAILPVLGHALEKLGGDTSDCGRQ